MARGVSRVPERSSVPRLRDGAVTVRVATPQDLDVVVELRLALLHEHADSPLYGRLRPDARRRAERMYAAQLAAPGEVIFLAEQDR